MRFLEKLPRCDRWAKLWLRKWFWPIGDRHLNRFGSDQHRSSLWL